MNIISVKLDSRYIGNVGVSMSLLGGSEDLWEGSVSRLYQLRLVEKSNPERVISSNIGRSWLGRVSSIKTDLADFGHMTTYLNLFQKSKTEFCGREVEFSLETFVDRIPDEFENIVFEIPSSGAGYSFKLSSKDADLSRMVGIAVTMIYSTVLNLESG